MHTATEAGGSSPSPKPSQGSSTRVLLWLLGGIPADAVWAALLISAGCLWAGYQVSDNLILLYGMWMLSNRKHYWHRWVALFFFTGIGFIAAHRFDMDKMATWLRGDLLPIMIILALQWMQGAKWLQVVSRPIGSLFARVKMHWIPFAILAASLTALLCGLRWSVYGGTLLLIVLLAAIRRDRLLVGGLIMAVIYDLVVHLFILKGALLIRENPLDFMAANWGTMLFPILALAGTAVTRASMALPSERLEKELVE